jgi:uncharacterized membrane protein (UPF0182 family)
MLGLSFRAKTLLLTVALGFGFFKLVDWTAEYFWFQALGYESVFWTLRELKVGFFLLAFIPALTYFWINFRIFASGLDLGAVASALTAQFGGQTATPYAPPGSTTARIRGSDASRAGTPGVLVFAAIVLALIFGLVFYSQWDTLARFWWAQAFGEVDPIYSRDIGFYLFKLPFLELVQSSLLAASFLASTLLVAGYHFAGVLRAEMQQGIKGPPKVLWHVAANLVLFLLALAWGFYLDRYALLQSTRGAVYGAGYTDVHVMLPAIWVMLGATLGLAAILLAPRFRKKGIFAPLVLGGYLTILFLSLVIAPWGVQSFLVEPNELRMESPFLRHNIALTRKAYQLDHVDERSYGALGGLTPAALSHNRQTIDNIRLWDWRPLSQTFRQLQQIRTYYEFGDVDVDRYRIDGADRQVMLAARELSDTLPGKAETWLNRRLQYTHGYGLAMSLTATKSPEGSPILVVKDLPPRAAGGLSMAQPAVYYGENMPGYCIVTTAVQEFDYPQGDRNVYTSYGGGGGVPVGSFWKRLLFAWHQFDANILITSYITPESRIQFWRDVEERIERIAPFLLLDEDPYPVLSDERLYWVQDAYTVSSLFPYAEPHRAGYNYIRNSVKVVVDAYNGEVTFYVIDREDPVLGVYRQALPDLFSAIEEMPDDLRRHLRYPQDLFEAQVTMYSTYHMTVPQVFYNSEDLWAAPREKYGGEVIDMKPYYILMRLPGEAKLQFLLMTPLTPARRANMIAWMAARSDFPGYGELVVYKLPKERLILGPIQVEATIDQDTLISQQLSLWDQRGSRVIRGNLLVIPIEQSFVYVEPVYLIAEDSEIPQLKRVIVSDGQRLAMDPTLEGALNVVFGAETKPPSQDAVGEVGDALSEAREALTTAEEALREADWETFGRAMQELKKLLGR